MIDGIELTDFMLKYNVGVEVAKKYTVYRIDNDYFEFEE
ncbi:mrr restriction system protein [Listeria aquatica FSL S10-1188]|uniref:Mrr restriction system protein n=1 Tax=Listeria aquatica FSL S10-1188 TaxID=1265818 RepID=W7B7H6_9LIST|nr:mrr restriction system protein [Listeria aquatica FSL S10-1188]